MIDFSTRVLQWFDVHGRKSLPWQQSITPYRVWVSEIMLQQTQVQTVIPYFERFMQSFPSIEKLAGAEQDAVLSHWSGLGYYARARNLHAAAQQIVAKHNGVFPLDFDSVVELPGIGRSTAGAILSIAAEQRHPILDGNVKRVLARHRMIAGWAGKNSVAANLWQAAEDTTPKYRVADYTQAIMDLGATLCTRSKPRCTDCPVAQDCMAFSTDVIADYPGRKPRKEKPLRKTTMVLANASGHVYLERRPEQGIWGGLWSLPELGELSIDDWCADRVLDVQETEQWQPLRHSFSHYDLDILPLVVRIEREPGTVADRPDAIWQSLNGQLPGGVAAPVKKLIDQLKKNDYVSHH